MASLAESTGYNTAFPELSRNQPTLPKSSKGSIADELMRANESSLEKIRELENRITLLSGQLEQRQTEIETLKKKSR